MCLYVRDLGEAEEARLGRWAEGLDQDLRHRAKLILLSNEGYRVPEIGRVLGAHPANLRKWIRRFNEQGLAGLVSRRSRGAKPRFTEDQKQRIVRLASTSPRKLGLTFSNWTLHRLADQARERQIVDRISHEYVRQILQAANCAYRRSGGTPREIAI